MKTSVSTGSQRMADRELEVRRCQLVLKRIFDQLFVCKSRSEGQSFAGLEATLDGLFGDLAADLELEWKQGRGRLSEEEKLEFGKLLTNLSGLFHSQKRHLLLQNNQSTALPENEGGNK